MTRYEFDHWRQIAATNGKMGQTSLLLAEGCKWWHFKKELLLLTLLFCWKNQISLVWSASTANLCYYCMVLFGFIHLISFNILVPKQKLHYRTNRNVKVIHCILKRQVQVLHIAVESWALAFFSFTVLYTHRVVIPQYSTVWHVVFPTFVTA